jgi:hypothetical protein
MDDQPDVEDQLIEQGKLSEGTTISGSGWPFPERTKPTEVISEMKAASTAWELAHEDAHVVRQAAKAEAFTENYRLMKLAASFVAAVKRGINSIFSF